MQSSQLRNLVIKYTMKNPSTRCLNDLPSLDELVRLSKAFAMLDAILSPEWDSRYYSFNAHWGAGEMMGSMRNGSGDEYFILFNKQGAAIKGFDHEAIMSPWGANPPTIWPGMYDSVPDYFSSFLSEEAFAMDQVTYCFWRSYDDKAWQCGISKFPVGNDPDGSEWMLNIFSGEPVIYQQFAKDYYEVDLELAVVQQIYEHTPLTDEIVKVLNGDLDVIGVKNCAIEIGYPVYAS